MDSTRRGKRFPDSMSKTIPIWTCVLNRAISNYLNESGERTSAFDAVSDSNACCGLIINAVVYSFLKSFVYKKRKLRIVLC